MSLNHINYIQITPQNKIQLLLGTNGSGKSSILTQITPLPANHQDYHKGGYKVIELIHNNSRYILKSLFNEDGNKYHFIKDDIELNDGLKATTFTELVRQEFRITQEIQDVMTGSQTFTRMEVGQRRNWFTKISDADYTYAIKYFSRLKEQHRDMTGAIKLHQSRLVQESEKLLTPELEDKYRKEIIIFNDLLVKLLDNKTPTRVSKLELNKSIESLESELMQLVSKVKQSKSNFPNNEGFLSKEAIEDQIIEQKAKLRSLESEIETIATSIENQDKTLQVLKDSNLGSIDDIDSSIDTQLNNVANLKMQNRLGLVFTDPTIAYQALQSVSDNLIQLASELTVNVDRQYSRDSYASALERLKTLETARDQMLLAINDLVAKRKQLEHYKEHNQVECPKCSHVWHQGYEEAQYQSTLGQLGLLEAKRETVLNSIVDQQNLIERMRSYLEMYRTYVQLSRAWSALNPLWEYLTQTDTIFKEPNKLTQIVETLKGDLLVAMQLEVASKTLKDSLTLKESLQQSQETSISSLLEHSVELHHRLYTKNQELQGTKFLLGQFNTYKESIELISKATLEIEILIKQRESKTEDLITVAKMESLNDAIQLVQMELYDREQMIAKIDIQRAVIMNIQLQILELKEKSEVLKIAITELSPSQGLIAKGLTGFINHFVAQINNFIKKIWLYPMELIAIVPDEEDGVDLDYKFSVRVNDDSVIPDISRGSAGMREVIDLAFKVVSMQYLGLEKAPLILDEFGVQLDSAHRQSAHFAINNLINTMDFSQIFMVSHYESAYGSLKNADICVLHPSNINIPKDLVYNRNCKIS